MASNASYMVKGNNRIDDMSSQGSFMVRAPSGYNPSEGGSIMVKGGPPNIEEQESFLGSDDGKSDIEDT
jgi:hypothetical protein